MGEGRKNATERWPTYNTRIVSETQESNTHKGESYAFQGELSFLEYTRVLLAVVFFFLSRFVLFSDLGRERGTAATPKDRDKNTERIDDPVIINVV